MSVAIPKGILGYTWYKVKQIFWAKESIMVKIELERVHKAYPLLFCL